MRGFAFATAALAAVTLTSAPAAAQARVESIAKLCPDMTFSQVSKQIGELVQQYEFSRNPEEAEQQLAGLLCQQTAADATDKQEAEVREANVVQQAVVAPPPHFNGPRPHFNGPKPHFRGPHPRFAPAPQVHVHRLPPPPRHHVIPRRAPPPVVVAGGRNHGYPGEQSYGSQRRVIGKPIAPHTIITEHPPGTPRQYRCNADRRPATPGTGWCD